MTDPIKPTAKLVEELTKSLVDKGLLIESGWVGLSMLTIPPNAPPEQLEMMRGAFYAGAQHLWGTINSVLDEGTEPTPADLRRMEQIDLELRVFLEQFKRKHNLP